MTKEQRIDNIMNIMFIHCKKAKRPCNGHIFPFV